MGISSVPFATIRTLLLGLDFEETVVPGSHLLFKHAPSGIVFLFRLYGPMENANIPDLIGVRKHLDARGLLGAEAFDARVRKQSA